jgi:GNAT superfamily N-acetyltransferase
MHVTSARNEDLGDLLDLIAAYQELAESADPVDDDRNAAFLQNLMQDPEHSTVLVGRTSTGELVGVICIHCAPSLLDAGRVPRITDLFIHPDYRLQGFGHQLFDHAVRWARQRQHHKLVWSVENMNLTAQYLFDSVDGATQSGRLEYTLPLAKA